MRRCPQCGETKPWTEFYKGSETHGYQTYCKPCQKSRVMAVYYRRKAEGREPDAEKKCITCGEALPAARFYRAPLNPTGLTSRCRTCSQIRSLAKKYGMSEEEYRSLKWSCAICGTKQDLVVDHCHGTGKTRDVLCRRCNTAIGMFGDSTALLLAAVKYLRKH